MKAVRLGGSAVLLSQHVDGLELTCSVEQLPGLLLRDAQDPLERTLHSLQRLARAQTPQCAIETSWLWREDDRVILHPDGRRKGVRYCIECTDWIGFVASITARLPRITVQCRSEYLLEVGPQEAVAEVTGWVSDVLLPLVEGRPDEDVERWRIARLDLGGRRPRCVLQRQPAAALHLKVERPPRVRGAWGADLVSDRVRHYAGARLTGLTFGKRGGPVFARLYDKTREADAAALIRKVWAEALGKELSANDVVWRIEFELRPEFLRSLATDDGHVPSDPQELVAGHLDAIWNHLLTSWLILRDPRSASRLTPADRSRGGSGSPEPSASVLRPQPSRRCGAANESTPTLTRCCASSPVCWRRSVPDGKTLR